MYLFVYDVLVGRLRKPAPSGWMSVDAASRISRVVGRRPGSTVPVLLSSGSGQLSVEVSSETGGLLGAFPMATGAHLAYAARFSDSGLASTAAVSRFLSSVALILFGPLSIGS